MKQTAIEARTPQGFHDQTKAIIEQINNLLETPARDLGLLTVREVLTLGARLNTTQNILSGRLDVESQTITLHYRDDDPT